MKKFSFVLLALGALLFAAAMPGHAQSDPAVTFTGGTPTFSSGVDYTIGYEFTLNSPALVTNLGYYDDGGNGFTDSHPVGIWDGTGTLLGSLTITSSDTLTDGFRYAALSVPLLLLPGQTYTVGGVSGVNDRYIYNTTDTVFDPAVNFVNNAYVVASTLTYPTSSGVGQGYAYFGGSFEWVDVGAAPEPSTWVWVAAGGVGALVLRRARGKRVGA